MIRIIFASILALIAFTSEGQRVEDLVYKKDLQNLSSQINALGRRIDSLANIVAPPPVLNKCPNGPTVTSISGVTTTSLTAKITGEGLDKITVSIYDQDSTKLYYTNSFNYNSPENSISYNLLSGKYRLYVKGVNCTGVGSRAFTIKGPVAGKPDCPRGPTIWTTPIAATSSYVTFQFDGNGVDSLSWEIRKSIDNSLSVFGDIKPSSSIVTAVFGKILEGGDYILTIRGKSCTSKDDSRGFNIAAAGGGGTTPPPVPSTGAAIPKKMSSGLPENLNIYVEKAPSGGWLISDSSTYLPDKDHDLWYGINNFIVKTSTPLKNYLWPANTPLEVWKAQPKKSTSTLHKWSETGGEYDPSAAQGFNFNDSYPAAIFYFQPKDSALVASKQVAQWMDFTPDVSLPAGQVWVMPIGKIDSPELLIRKGVTHFSKYEVTEKPYEGQLISAGRVYNEVPKTPEQFSLTKGTGVSNWVPKVGGGREPITATPVAWPGPWNEMFFGKLQPGQTEPMTLEEGREAGRKFTTSMPLVVFENSENVHAIGAQWPFVGGFYETYVPRMEAEWLPKGIEPLIAHNYYTGLSGPGLSLGNNLALNKSIFRTPLSQWPASDLLNGGTLSKTTAVCYGYYLSSPDRTRDEAYKFIFASQIAKIAGKKILLFPQAFHEDRPNNFFEARFPDGSFFFQSKKKYTPAEMTNMSFFAQLFGKGTIPFGAAAKTTEEFRWAREWHANKGYLWKPKGSTGYQSDQSFPYFSDGAENMPAGTFEYALSEGVRIYCQTFAKVKGGKPAFLRYRIDGGSWINMTNQYMDDLVDAYTNQKPLVYSETKDGVTAVVYIWPYADTQIHTLEYELNGKTFARAVHSTIIHTYMHQ